MRSGTEMDKISRISPDVFCVSKSTNFIIFQQFHFDQLFHYLKKNLRKIIKPIFSNSYQMTLEAYAISE